MRALCRTVVGLFALAWLASLALLAIGTLGLFGSERDPLAGAYVVALGLPWVTWLDGLPEAVRPWLAALAPLVNLAMLALLCRVIRRR
jgi:hypothetical protein